MAEDRALHPPQAVPFAGLRGRCPVCGNASIFDGFLHVRERCPRCGLDLRFADSGDGPAVFVILIAGFFIADAALLVEIYSPPVLIHIILWPPLVLMVCLGLLRPLKGILVALQFHHRAEGGRVHRPD